MEINISVKHKSKPKLSQFLQAFYKTEQLYMLERDRDRGRNTDRQRDRKGEKCLGCMLKKSSLDRSKNKDQSSD